MARKNTEERPRRAASEAREQTPATLFRRRVILDAANNAHGVGNGPSLLRHPSPDEIATRAHQIYLARGATPGMELDDWLRAERELCLPGLRD